MELLLKQCQMQNATGERRLGVLSCCKGNDLSRILRTAEAKQSLQYAERLKAFLLCRKVKKEMRVLFSEMRKSPPNPLHTQKHACQNQRKGKARELQLFHSVGRSLLANKGLACTSDTPLHIWHSFSFGWDTTDLSRSSRLSIRPSRHHGVGTVTLTRQSRNREHY